MSPPLTDAQLNELLEEIPSLTGRPRQLQELSGGLTNRNVKVTTDDGVYVARCTDTATNMLGIDRDREYHNTKAAADAKIAAAKAEADAKPAEPKKSGGGQVVCGRAGCQEVKPGCRAVSPGGSAPHQNGGEIILCN